MIEQTKLHVNDADRLLEGLTRVDFSEAMKEMQTNWIGKSTGVRFAFPHEIEEDGKLINDGKLWVGGLHSARDYAGLLSILRADPSVRQVTTVQAHDNSVLLDVKATLPLSSLAANLAAGGHLLLQDGSHPGADVSLRWLP